MFSFYVLPALPFLILAVVYVLGAIMTPPAGMAAGAGRTDRQLIGTVVAGVVRGAGGALLRLLLSGLRGPADPVQRLVDADVARRPLDLTPLDQAALDQARNAETPAAQ